MNQMLSKYIIKFNCVLFAKRKVKKKKEKRKELRKLEESWDEELSEKYKWTNLQFDKWLSEKH